MSGNSIKINRLKFIFITGIIFASFYNFAKISYAAIPGVTLAAGDTTNITGNVITPSNISVDGKFALTRYSQFDLAAGDSAIMVLPFQGGIQAQYYINRMESAVNPFNIYGNITSQLESTGLTGGHLIFLSPNGINIGPNATINTNALTLSTANNFKVHNTSGADTLIGNDISGLNLKDLYDTTNVITYEDIANSVDSIISNEGTLGTSGSTTGVDILAGSIINDGANAKIYGDKINLITAGTAKYNVGTNTYTLTGIPNVTDVSLEPLGGISILQDSIIQGNNIKLISKTETTSGLTTPNAAINIDGLIQADVLAGNSGKITLVSEQSSGLTTDTIGITRISTVANASIIANGSNAEINIQGYNVNISDDGSNILVPNIINSGGNISIKAQNNIIFDGSATTANTAYLASGNQIKFFNDTLSGNITTSTTTGNTYIKTPDLLLDTTGGIIKSTGGDIYIGHIPSSVSGVPAVSGTLNISTLGTSSKINARDGAGDIFIGNNDKTSTYQNVNINGASYTTPKSLTSLTNFIGKNINILWPIIDDNVASVVEELVLLNQSPTPDAGTSTGDLTTNTNFDNSSNYNDLSTSTEQSSVVTTENDQTSSETSEINLNEISVNNETSTSTNNESTVSSNTENNEKSSAKPEENKKDSKETKSDNKGLSSEITKRGILNINKSNYKNYYGDELVKSLEKNNNKQNEFIADEKAADYALKSGYNPAGMVGFLMSVYFIEKAGNQLIANDSVKISSVFTYQHPKTIYRIKKSEIQLDKLGEAARIGGLTRKIQLDEIKKLIK